MKNVLKTLQTEKADVEKQFQALDDQRKEVTESRDKANTALSQIVAGLTQLQGKWAQLDKLEKEFSDEPKEK